VNVLIVTPFRGQALTGNRHTAAQWAEHLQSLGHSVTIAPQYTGQPADVLFALHAGHSHDSIVALRRDRPETPIVVVLTGSDIYPQPSAKALDSLQYAQRIVALQPRARSQVPEALLDRVRIIVQAVAHQSPDSAPKSRDPFDIGVIAHVREAKDPLRAAAAARLLPASSRIRVRLAGAILEEDFRPRIERELAENPRFEWLGEIDSDAVRELIASCQLVVVSSLFEGGARVVGESIVSGTPVLATHCDGVTSTVGSDYPGLFETGNTEQLAELLQRAETDEEYLALLHSRTEPLAARFDPRLEIQALQNLLAELGDSR